MPPITKHPALPYVAPFAVFVAFLAVAQWVPYPVRVVVVTAVLLLVSRHVIPWRISNPIGSVLLGVAVFVVWVGPDLLWPAYRTHWLFQNPVTGSAKSSLTATPGVPFVIFRVLGSIALVPIIEELFWRGWLMRWIIAADFRRVPLGSYTPFSFWVVVLLFASEHGSYWEVGLIAGAVYNWWLVHTKNLADCILAHATTNACLSLYVLIANQWQYWL